MYSFSAYEARVTNSSKARFGARASFFYSVMAYALTRRSSFSFTSNHACHRLPTFRHLYPISLMCSLSPCQCRQNFASARILIACMPSGIASGVTCLLKAFAHALPPLALLTQKRDLRFRTLWSAGPLRSCAGCLSCSHQYCGLFSRSGSLAMLDAIRCASSRVRRICLALMDRTPFRPDR